MPATPTYTCEVRHEGLNKYRLIKAKDPYVAEQMAEAQAAQWDEQWAKREAAEAKRQARAAAAQEKEAKKQLAVERTSEAEVAIAAIQGTLHYTLDIDDRIDWESLKDHGEFPVRRPAKPVDPEIPSKPRRESQRYQPRLGLMDKVVPGAKQKKIDQAARTYAAAVRGWEADKKALIAQANAERQRYNEEVVGWDRRRRAFVAQQERGNAAVQKDKKRYQDGNADAIEDYCNMVLTRSNYPDEFPQTFELDYTLATMTLVVDYQLPPKEILPTVKQVKYVQTRDEFTETHLKAAELNKLYDSLLYQIALRTIHEIYEADAIAAIESVVFNGWVDSIDESTGKELHACILSVQAGRAEFLEIDLARVDPKACFKKLKGVGSSQLHSLAPVAPIIQIDREDERFVSAQSVTGELDDSVNLAAMPWEDFEHLVRELFEQEFKQNGGEVKVTRASRDGGVDAVAFDPDPIRGGKIVIQAKRYTNAVGVTAVRDLYGTVMNEGATKGILVTTSDYGPDAYNFVKDKPLTLISGGNLLHMLEKHGHRAKIDLREAKELLAKET